MGLSIFNDNLKNDAFIDDMISACVVNNDPGLGESIKECWDSLDEAQKNLARAIYVQGQMSVRSKVINAVLGIR